MEELREEHTVSSPTRSSDLDSNPVPLATSQHELLATQGPGANNCFNPPPVSTSRSFSSTTVINEIGLLMQKVEDLSRSIPTTADRLSKSSGLFPPGHGPSAEAVKEETEHEVMLLDSLRVAASYVRTGFVEFGSKQDSVCREYEREASIIESQIREQDTDGNAAKRFDNSYPCFDTGLGQSAAADAEVTFF